MAQPAWDIKKAQYELEKLIELTVEERFWVMRNKDVPVVRKFWSTYKRALNFLYDTDKVNNVKKDLKFVRNVMRSGFNLEDPRYTFIKE
jgi:hypothetical protein